MVNSAWQVYSGLPPIPIAGADVVATFNVASNPISMATLLSKTTNNATWNGVARTNGRIGKISYRYVVEEFDSETVEYYQVTMPISFRPDSWKWLPIDSGTDILVATTSSGQPVWKAVLDQYGNRVTTPVLLNGSGAQGTVGFTGVVYPASGYEQYTESDWTAGGVPNPF
jgi:flavin-binding protein dodecin